MLGRLEDLFERLASARRRKLLALLADGPLSEAELGRHFLFRPTVHWHLRELHGLGLIAYSRRADRYHLVWPALEELAAFCAELDAAPTSPDQTRAPASAPSPAGRGSG
jgi:hypothetical protein